MASPQEKSESAENNTTTDSGERMSPLNGVEEGKPTVPGESDPDRTAPLESISTKTTTEFFEHDEDFDLFYHGQARLLWGGILTSLLLTEVTEPEINDALYAAFLMYILVSTGLELRHLEINDALDVADIAKAVVAALTWALLPYGSNTLIKEKIPKEHIELTFQIITWGAISILVIATTLVGIEFSKRSVKGVKNFFSEPKHTPKKSRRRKK